MGSRTPYNSVYYEIQKGVERKEDVVCCVHGVPCDEGKTKEKDEDANYEDLCVPRSKKKEKTRRATTQKHEKSLTELYGKLKNLKTERSKKKAKVSKKQYRVVDDCDELKIEINSNSEKEKNREDSDDSEAEQRYDNVFVESRPPREDSSKKRREKKRQERKSQEKKRAERKEMERKREERMERERKNQQRSMREKSEKSEKKKKREERRSRAVKVSGNPFEKDEEDDKMVVRNIYIGVCNFEKAEQKVMKKGEFRLYHQLSQRIDLDELVQDVPLMICYKTTNGSYRHYPIRVRRSGEKELFYVDYGDPTVDAHSSLAQLVRYYQINAQLHPRNVCYADSFPWWEKEMF